MKNVMNLQELERIWYEVNAPIRFARISLNNKEFWTLWRGLDSIEFLTSSPWESQKFWACHNVKSLVGCRFLAPCEPTKIVCLAHNYKSLIGDMKEYPLPLIFLKSVNALAGYCDTIFIPPSDNRTWQEVELGMVVSKRARNVSVKKALEHMFGYTVANDISTENLASRDHHLAQSKSLDGFCPCGPFLMPDVNTSEIRITSSVNNVQKQDGSTADRLFTDAETISYISQFMTLEPGDLLLTGTCSGWKETTLLSGDFMEVSIEGIGSLRNDCQVLKHWRT